MRSRARKIAFGLALMGLVLWAIGIRDAARIPQSAPTPPQTRELQPEKKSARKARSSSNVPYDFSPIQAKLKTHRLQLAACLLRNPKAHARQYRLTLNWEPLGLLRQARLDPDAGNAVEGCIRDLARTWRIRPHPALQPFSYSALLIPGGI